MVCDQDGDPTDWSLCPNLNLKGTHIEQLCQAINRWDMQLLQITSRVTIGWVTYAGRTVLEPCCEAPAEEVEGKLWEQGG